MGAVDFDLGKWLGEPSVQADPAKAATSAKVEPETPPTLATFAGLAAQPRAEMEKPFLPSRLIAGMDRLLLRQPPRLADPAAWTRIVADAERIVRDGWAAQALGLGWSLHDQFGIGPKDSWEFSGLAVWLNDRRIILLDADVVIARSDSGDSYFNRGGWGRGRDADQPPVLLWEFGGPR